MSVFSAMLNLVGSTSIMETFSWNTEGMLTNSNCNKGEEVETALEARQPFYDHRMTTPRTGNVRHWLFPPFETECPFLPFMRGQFFWSNQNSVALSFYSPVFQALKVFVILPSDLIRKTSDCIARWFVMGATRMWEVPIPCIWNILEGSCRCSRERKSVSWGLTSLFMILPCQVSFLFLICIDSPSPHCKAWEGPKLE